MICMIFMIRLSVLTYVHYPLSTIHYSLFTIPYSLSTIHYPLPSTPYLLLRFDRSAIGYGFGRCGIEDELTVYTWYW
jgi:hypothetical protein